MLVLRINEREWERSDALAKSQREMSRFLSTRPEIHAGNFDAAFDDCVGEADLSVELDSPSRDTFGA